MSEAINETPLQEATALEQAMLKYSVAAERRAKLAMAKHEAERALDELDEQLMEAGALETKAAHELHAAVRAEYGQPSEGAS